MSKYVYVDDFSRFQVTVQIRRRLLWRMRLGVAVMRLGAWIATFGFEVEEIDG